MTPRSLASYVHGAPPPGTAKTSHDSWISDLQKTQRRFEGSGRPTQAHKLPATRRRIQTLGVPSDGQRQRVVQRHLALEVAGRIYAAHAPKPRSRPLTRTPPVPTPPPPFYAPSPPRLSTHALGLPKAEQRSDPSLAGASLTIHEGAARIGVPLLTGEGAAAGIFAAGFTELGLVSRLGSRCPTSRASRSPPWW